MFEDMPENAMLCVETRSLKDLEKIKAVKHISEFCPEKGDASSRASARARVARLSETVLESTGKPVWQSFDYRGISAWWFLEILFQEPCYLVTRREQALSKAVATLGDPALINLPSDRDIRLPLVPAQKPLHARGHARTQPSFKARVKRQLQSWWLVAVKKPYRDVRRSFLQWKERQLRRLVQLRFLYKLKRSDVLCIIEHENLRRHIEPEGKDIRSILPYAEGVIEELHDALGEQCLVLTRRPVSGLFEAWEFLGPALPPLSYKPLPAKFDDALDEIWTLAKPYIKHYVSLDTMREVMILRLAEYDFYLDLLDRVKPKAVFSYNWEGVFRPLTTAARVKGCKVIGVQQALGPYLHALDHHETGYYNSANPRGFAIPDKIALWGELHRSEFLSYDYPPQSIEVTGYARLDKHYHAKARTRRMRESVCRQLKLDPDGKYLVFTGQSRVLDTILLRDEHFISTIKCLCKLADEFGFKIIMKPWTSDDINMMERAAGINPGTIFIAPQNVMVSNADLLSISDWLVGTFSSIIGEATLVGNACVLLNYPESRYYFDLPHVEHYRAMIPFVDRPEDFEKVLRPLLEDERARSAVIEKAQTEMKDLFGPCDGGAGHRIAQLVIGEAAGNA